MRDGPWKLIYVQDYGYALYNLAEDLGEASNVAATYPKRVETMKRDLERWRGSLEQPRWGRVELRVSAHRPLRGSPILRSRSR